MTDTNLTHTEEVRTIALKQAVAFLGQHVLTDAAPPRLRDVLGVADHIATYIRTGRHPQVNADA